MANDLSAKIPLIETYGPVLQGEGALIGRPTWFVRLGGCDYLCSSCDSLHAVDPAQIEKNKTVMSAKEIGERTLAEMGDIPLVTLSGGNPLLWDMKDFIGIMVRNFKKVAVETQGTYYKSWIHGCDSVTVSPKGPGMIGDQALTGLAQFGVFISAALYDSPDDCLTGWNVKIPVFGIKDLDYCRLVKTALRDRQIRIPMYISVGNLDTPGRRGDAAYSLAEHRHILFAAYEALTARICKDFPDLLDSPILPQLHVLQYGNEQRR